MVFKPAKRKPDPLQIFLVVYGSEQFPSFDVLLPIRSIESEIIMATEYERPSKRIVERHYTSDSGIGVIVGLILALAIGAFVFLTFYDRAAAPSAPAPPTTPPPAPSIK